MAAQPGLCRTWSETRILVFTCHGSISTEVGAVDFSIKVHVLFKIAIYSISYSNYRKDLIVYYSTLKQRQT